MLCSRCSEGHVKPGHDREHVCALTGLPVPDSKLLWGCPLEIDVFTRVSVRRTRWGEPRNWPRCTPRTCGSALR